MPIHLHTAIIINLVQAIRDTELTYDGHKNVQVYDFLKRIIKIKSCMAMYTRPELLYYVFSSLSSISCFVSEDEQNVVTIALIIL